MSELERRQAQTLDALVPQINAEHRAFAASLSKTAEHGIRAGELLAEAKAQCPHGTWLRWLEENFEGVPRTAQTYMQLYNHRDEVRANTQNAAHLSLSGALREIAAPREDAEESGGEEQNMSLGEELVAKINGKEKTEKEIKDELKKLRQEKKEAEEAKKALEEELEEKRKEVIERTEKQYREAIAALHAKYGDPEQPKFLGISGEAWAQAFENAKSHRVEEVAKHLHQIYGWPKWMGNYSPEEAADAIRDMGHGDELSTALTYVANWLHRVLDEVEA